MSHEPTRRFVTAQLVFVRLGRIGWFAKGVIYVLAGILALSIVGQSFGWSGADANGNEANPTGALNEVARSRGGPLLLIVLAVGMFFYATWCLATVVVPGRNVVAEWAKRFGALVSVITYVTLGTTAIALAKTRSAIVDGDTTISDITTRIMPSFAGRWIIGIIAAIIIAIGLYQIVKGLKFQVTEDINMVGMSVLLASWTRRLESVGEVGGGIALGLIGFFLVRAALTFDPAEATGLDGGLRRLAQQSWGVLIVVGVGLGLVAYGLFCIMTFTRRRLHAPVGTSEDTLHRDHLRLHHDH